MKCTFFGNRDTSSDIKPILKNIVNKIIEQYNVDTFYVGNQGNFDNITVSILKEIAKDNPKIKYYVVLAYMPNKANCNTEHPTLYPEGLEKVPKRFAISKRNQWMLNKSDIIITHTINTFGNSIKLKNQGKNKNKIVIDIIDFKEKDL